MCRRHIGRNIRLVVVFYSSFITSFFERESGKPDVVSAL